MMRLLLMIPLVALIAIGLSGCGGGAATGPPEINYGRDVCAECHMIISEARYAAAYRDAEGEPFVFDDIGDMIRHGVRAGVLDEAATWVHDFQTEEWIDAPAAWFVRAPDVGTPMASGLAAFTFEADARSFALREEGEVFSWDELLVAEGDGAP